MFREILRGFIFQSVGTIGVIFLFGWLIAQCNKRFYANFGRRARTVCYVTGFFGTPVHELSHALFCVLFGHKIVEIKLFSLNSADGTLGYVNHIYNRENFYQRIGNFFIGVVPILVISALLYLISCFLLSPFTSEMNVLFSGIAAENAAGILKAAVSAIGTFFSLITTWEWWVFLAVGIFLSLHMTLSGADIKNAISGLIFVLILLFVTDIILGWIGTEVLEKFTSAVLKGASYLLCFLIMALLISAMALIVSCFYKIISKKLR